MATPLMLLDLPVVGPSGTAGPTYATMNNAAFTTIDSHDHSPGKGTLVTTAGLSINADLAFGSFNATALKSSRYTSQGALLVGVNDKTCVYVYNGDLYYNNSAGTAVKITNGAAIDITSVGGFTGDYTTTAGVEANYSDTTKTYTFKQTSTKTADIAGGSLFVYENIVSAKYNKIRSSPSLASDQTITLPSALPGSTRFVTMSSSGQLSTTAYESALSLPASTKMVSITSGGVLGTGVSGIVTQAELQTRTSPGSTATAGQIAVSASSGSYTQGGNAGNQAVTNLSVTITTTGRPVRVQLIAASGLTGASSGRIGFSDPAAASISGEFLIVRDGAGIATHELRMGTTPADSKSIFIPCTSINHLDVVAAGTYVYTISQYCAASVTCQVTAVSLLAYEI